MILKLIVVCSLIASSALGSAVKGYSAESSGAVKGGGLPQRHYEAPTKTYERQQLQREEQQRQTKTIVQLEQKQLPAAPQLTKTHEEPRQLASAPQQPSKTSNAKTIERAVEQQTEIIREEPAPVQQKQEEHHYAIKGSHYEAKPAVRLEETKGQTVRYESQQRLEEQQPLATKSINSEQELATKGSEQQKRLEEQRLEQQRLEQQRLEEQKLEQQRADQQRLEQQRIELQKLEQQRLEQQQHEEQQQTVVEVQSREQQQQYEQRRFGDEQQQVVLVQQREETKGGAISYKVQQQQLALGAEPEPYAFDYSVEGSSRRESGDTKGVVRGQYTLQNADGSSRLVEYVADHNGFRATVNTNEFGTESRSPAGVEVRSSQPSAEEISLRIEGKTRQSLEAPVKGAAPLAPAPVEPVPKRPDNWNVKQAPVSLAAPAPAPIPIQQQQQQVLEEAPLHAAIKGKSVEENGYRAEQKLESYERVEQQQQQQVELYEATPKGSELHAPKAELKRVEEPAQLRSFESATAHRTPVVAAAAPASSAPHYSPAHQPSGGVLRNIIRPLSPIHHHNQHHHQEHHLDYHHRQQHQHLQPARAAQYPSPRLPHYGASAAVVAPAPDSSIDDSAASFAE